MSANNKLPIRRSQQSPQCGLRGHQFSCPAPSRPRLDDLDHRFPLALNALHAASGMDGDLEDDEVPGQAAPSPGGYSSSSLPLRAGSGLSQSETWAGCMVSRTAPTSSSFSVSRSVSSRSFAEKL